MSGVIYEYGIGFFLLLTLPISAIDYCYHRIPDILVIPGIIFSCAFRIFIIGTSWQMVLLLFGFGLIPFYVIRLWSRGRIGLGDVKLSAFLSIVLGVEGWLLMVFFSSLAAVGFAYAALRWGKLKRSTRIPYGPFLSGGAILAFGLVQTI